MGLLMAAGDLQQLGKLAGEDDLFHPFTQAGAEGVADMIPHHHVRFFSKAVADP